MSLLNLFKKKVKLPEFHIKAEHKIELAFECDGVAYYHFPQVFDIPCMRAMSAVQFYEEMRMRMTKDFMLLDAEAHAKINEGLRAVLSGKTGGIDLGTAHKMLAESDMLISQKKERLEWIAEPETIYNLASVVYFDATENPYQFDSAHAKIKIDRWKKSNDKMLDFFLSQPISNYMPYFAQLKVDTGDYIAIVEELSKAHLEAVSQILSKKS